MNYGEYVQAYIDAVDPQLLCMDHYPHFAPWSGSSTWPNCSKSGYRANLDVFRATGLPWWNFFNTMPFGGHTDPTEAELRWQAFTCLAYGSSGVLWFCYWTPAGFPTDNGIITPKLPYGLTSRGRVCQ